MSYCVKIGNMIKLDDIVSSDDKNDNIVCKDEYVYISKFILYSISEMCGIDIQRTIELSYNMRWLRRAIYMERDWRYNKRW